MRENYHESFYQHTSCEQLKGLTIAFLLCDDSEANSLYKILLNEIYLSILPRGKLDKSLHYLKRMTN